MWVGFECCEHLPCNSNEMTLAELAWKVKLIATIYWKLVDTNRLWLCSTIAYSGCGLDPFPCKLDMR